jgi:hypothetical protein
MENKIINLVVMDSDNVINVPPNSEFAKQMEILHQSEDNIFKDKYLGLGWYETHITTTYEFLEKNNLLDLLEYQENGSTTY